jgi:hypothetical protein
VALFEKERRALPVGTQQVYFGWLVAASFEPNGRINSGGAEALS